MFLKSQKLVLLSLLLGVGVVNLQGLDTHLINPALAQSSMVLKVQADQALQKGFSQFDSNQPSAAIESWQMALKSYREIGDREGETNALNSLGNAYFALANYPKAIEHYQRVVVIARELKDLLREGTAIGNLGNVYNSLSQYDRAIEFHNQALAIANKINDQTMKARALNGLGLSSQSLSQYQQAIAYYEQVRDLVRKLGNRRGEGIALQNLGSVYASLDQYEQATQYHQQALAIFRQIGNQLGEVRALGGLGGAAWSLDRYEEAIKYHQQALEIAQKIGDAVGKATALSDLGYGYYSLRQYELAIKFHQQSLELARKLGSPNAEASMLLGLGQDYLALGQYQQASQFYQEALNISRQIKSRSGESRSLIGLGMIYTSLGQYEQARNQLQKASEITRAINDRDGEARALHNLGDVYRSQGRYREALIEYRRVLVITQQIKARSLEGSALNSLGNIYNFIGQPEQALTYHEKALAIAREIKDPSAEANSLNSYGNAFASLINYEQARSSYQDALKINEKISDLPGQGVALSNLGEAYNSLGQPKQAITYHEKALAIARKVGDPAAEGRALTNLGVVYASLNQYNQAIDLQQQALSISRRISDRRVEGIALNNLGLAMRKANRLPEAEKILFEGIQAWESIRELLNDQDAFRISIFEAQSRTYRTLQEVLIAQNKTDAALEVAERGRTQAFLALLARRAQGVENKRQSDVARISIEGMQQIAKSQQATLVEYSIFYKDSGIKQFEKEQNAKIAYLYIWVIQPTGKTQFHRVDLTDSEISLSNLVALSRQSIGVRGRGSIEIEPIDEAAQTKQLQQLYKLLIAPITNHLPIDPSARIIFIPQGELFLVPFPALQDTSGKYLIEKHTILTAPGIQVLNLTQQRRSEVRQINLREAVVVGNPAMPKVTLKLEEPPQQLSSLPGTEQEATEIAQRLNTKAVIGVQATKAAILPRLAQARIIHFATHGLLDDFKGQGVPGAIALAPSGNGELNDGLLTTSEILDMKLNAELVVLSACDTGRGQVTGDGVIGLSRSLIAAGVPSVLVSLWSVPDAPTAGLMIEFYRNWQERKLDKAQALRQAMLTTMKQHPDPKNWAAFTLIGETE